MKHGIKIVLIAAAAALVLPGVARAQYYSSVGTQPVPLYPYAVQGQPYAVQVAPNTYVIHRPHARPTHVREREARANPPAEKRFDKPPQKADRALIEELRRRNIKRTVINTQKIVRDPPVVIETKRYVDDPPRIIERHHVVEDAPARGKQAGAEPRGTNKKRVIRAEAEVTILGPDRMSIRLFRKRSGTDAKAEADAD